jgi:hypothetical protein
MPHAICPGKGENHATYPGCHRRLETVIRPCQIFLPRLMFSHHRSYPLLCTSCPQKSHCVTAQLAQGDDASQPYWDDSSTVPFEQIPAPSADPPGGGCGLRGRP